MDIKSRRLRKLSSHKSGALDSYVSLSKEYGELEVAAAHIEDAKYGRGQHGKAFAMENGIFTRLSFNITSHNVWIYFLHIVNLVHCWLLFKPINNTFLAIEACCVFVYFLDVGLKIIIYTPAQFFTLSKTGLKIKLQLILTFLFLVDFAYTVYHLVVTIEDTTQRLAIPFQFLRPAIFVIRLKTVYHIFIVVVRTIGRIFTTLLGIMSFILFFCCIAVHLYGDVYNSLPPGDEGLQYLGQFNNVLKCFIRMFVLITTENYPEVMVPVYRIHKANIIFFFIFLYIGVFILMSILLAIVVDNYWKVAKLNVKKERLKGRVELAEAWKILGDGAETIFVDDPRLLEVFRMLKPENDDEEIAILLQQIANPQDGSTIDYKHWLTKTNDILDLEIERNKDEDDTNLMSSLVRKGAGKGTIYLTLFIQSPVLQRLIIILLIFHTFLFVLADVNHPMLGQVVQYIRVGLSCLFMVETALRCIILAYLNWDGDSPKPMKSKINRWFAMVSARNILDGIMVVLALCFNILSLFIYLDVIVPDIFDITPYLANGLCVVISTIFLMIRLLLNLSTFKRLYSLVKIFVPVLLDLTWLYFICVFSFASLGETIFIELAKEDSHSSSSSSSPWSGDDDKNDASCGFDDILCSVISIFQVSTTSNWHEIFQATFEKTNGHWITVLYFVFMYIIMNFVIMNLFVAICYEAYNKFVSKPKQAKKKANSAKILVSKKEKARRTLRKVRTQLSTYTAGSRKKLSAAPSPVRRRTSVTIKRKSLRGIHEKISDSSLGDHVVILMDGENGIGTRTRVNVIPKKTPDLSQLTPEKRREAIQKQRKQKRAENRGKRGSRGTGEPPTIGFADVVRQYKAKSDEEISLAPGQKVKIIDRAGTQCKGLLLDGPNAGKRGWFPAFVVGALVTDMNRAAAERKPLPKTDSQPRFVKRQNADWTKDIIGPMTIINPEELKELNKILKANARGSRNSTDNSKGMSMESPRILPAPAILEEEEEEDEEDQVFKMPETPQMELPKVIIEQPSIILEEEEEEQLDKRKLQSPKIKTPEMKAKEKWRKKAENKKSGDIPDWAKRFMVQANSKVSASPSVDLKSAAAVDPVASTDPLGTVLVNPVVKSLDTLPGVVAVVEDA